MQHGFRVGLCSRVVREIYVKDGGGGVSLEGFEGVGYVPFGSPLSRVFGVVGVRVRCVHSPRWVVECVFVAVYVSCVSYPGAGSQAGVSLMGPGPRNGCGNYPMLLIFISGGHLVTIVKSTRGRVCPLLLVGYFSSGVFYGMLRKR